MKFGKKVVVAVNLAITSPEQLKVLRQIEFLKHSEVHFVHVHQTITYPYGISFGEISLIYPVESDRHLLRESVTASLQKLSHEAMPPGSDEKISHHCLFSENPKEKLCEYANEIHADTIVVMMRERHGFFESSFAQYVNRHSKSNVVILKHLI